MKERLPTDAYLVVALGHHLMALPVASVVRVERRVATTPLLASCTGVEGLIRFADQVIAVVDLATALSVSAAPATLDDSLLVLQTHGWLWAAHVSRAAGVVEVPIATNEAEKAELLTQQCVTQRVITDTEGIVQILNMQQMQALASRALAERPATPGGWP